MGGRRGSLLGGLIIVAGGVGSFLDCRAHRHLEDAVLILGVSLALAWLVTTPHPVRFLPSGLVLSGIGGGLVVARVAEEAAYRGPLLLVGVALALVLIYELQPARLVAAAAALAWVAALDALLIWGPAHIDARDIWTAFLDGWGFGVGQVVYGVLVIAGASLPGGSGGR